MAKNGDYSTPTSSFCMRCDDASRVISYHSLIDYFRLISLMARTKNHNVKRRSKSGPITNLRSTAKTEKFCILKLPFAHLVRKIIFAVFDEHPEYELSKYDVRIQKEAIECLQLASEAHVIDFFECLQILSEACKLVAIMQREINFYLAQKM